MPANLSPEYLRLDERLRQVRDPQEKLVILREMLAAIPKHKGTDKLQADLKRRISKMEEGVQQRAKRGGRDPFHVPREGIGQVLLAGAPNAGKSSLLSKLTNATPAVAGYPFTTHQPLPGMVAYEDVQIQLVDMPPLSRDYTEAALFNTYRVGDIILLVIDMSDPDPAVVVQECIDLFDEHLIHLVPHLVDSAGNLSTIEKQALILANKIDLAGASAPGRLAEAGDLELPVLNCSAETGEGLAGLPERLFHELRLVRVYTKKPGKKFVRDAPFVLPEGSTVLDVARAIHKDFADGLRSVRLWGSGKHDGIPAPRDHFFNDTATTEIYTR